MKFRATQPQPDIEIAALGPLLADRAFQQFCDALPDACLVILADATLAYANQAAERLLEQPRGRLIGHKVEALAEETSFDWTQLLEVLHTGGKADLVLQDEEGRRFLATARFLRDRRRQVLAAVFMLRDLQLLDHHRRLAGVERPQQVFALAGERDLKPDFRLQRRVSPALDDLINRAERAALQGVRVLLTGESGVGKTEIARYIRGLIAGGAPAPFIHLNCAAIPESLFESEMFGYERGAFTGAHHAGKPGLIEAAEGGVLFLDEIGEVPLASQAKLLRFLEDNTLQRVGSSRARQVRSYIISATNRDLAQLVAEGRFRRDLYYRLAVIRLEVPPLRAQPALVEHLIDHFVAGQNRNRARPLRLDPECRRRLSAYGFPGNIRELSNIIQQLAALADEVATVEHLPPPLLQEPPPALATPLAESLSLREMVRSFERQVIEAAVRGTGSKRKAAQLLNVDIGTIVRKSQATKKDNDKKPQGKLSREPEQ